MTLELDRLSQYVRDVPDYPKPGVTFKDITPVLSEPSAFSHAVAAIGAPFVEARFDKVLGVEARGFVFAAPVALEHRAGFVPVRKPGKLPGAIERERYELEYGSDLLEIHRDALAPGDRVLVVDDVLATGGTAAATVRLARRLGADVVGCAFLLELAFLNGRERIHECAIHAVLRYE